MSFPGLVVCFSQGVTDVSHFKKVGRRLGSGRRTIAQPGVCVVAYFVPRHYPHIEKYALVKEGPTDKYQPAH